ncbi:hypothetical protein ACQBAR_09145 [Propionibacteriaceae bacterium Y1685]
MRRTRRIVTAALSAAALSTTALLAGGGGVAHAGSMTPEIEQKWQQLGGADGEVGEFRSEKAVDGGQHANFVGGDITHRSDAGAHFVHGGILYAWRSDGATGTPGFATSDEMAGAVGGSVRQDFTGADYYWKSGLGAHKVYGAIRTAYDEAGAEGSKLGLPLVDEANAEHGYAQQTFQGGTITWQKGKGTTVEYGERQLLTASADKSEAKMGDTLTITIRVTDAQGKPVSDADVQAYPMIDGGPETWGPTDANGVITKKFTVMEGGVTRFDDEGMAIIPIWTETSNQLLVDHTGDN